MSALDLILQQRHLEQLRGLVLRPDGVEASAYLLCGTARIKSDPWERQARLRLISHEVVPVPQTDRISASAVHVTWSTQSFVSQLRRAQAEKLVPGIVHAHPSGPSRFSDQDDRNESELARLAQNRNGSSQQIMSLLLTGAGELHARVWHSADSFVDARTITVVGDRLSFQGGLSHQDLEVFARQVLAFGPQYTARLRTMRIAIVGCGGTGSAVAMLLARLGVGQIVLIDLDIVDVTNLNRLHGSCRADADAMRPKVDTLAAAITEMSLGTRVIGLNHWVGDVECRDALRSCDVIFGCTDDHEGRLFLNRFAYFYAIPVIDMGLAIDPMNNGSVRELSGRTTVLVPGAPCLLCRGVVDPVLARDENLRRQYPEEYERRKREAYVRGSGNAAPAVVTFTTETACMAVNELLQGLTGFRDTSGWIYNRVRRFDRMEDRRPGAKQDASCPICSESTYWGRGDIDPFLDRVG